MACFCITDAAARELPKVRITKPAPHRAALMVFILATIANPSCVIGTWFYTYLFPEWTTVDVALYTVLPRTIIAAFMHWLDVTALDGFDANVKIAEAFGYSRSYVLRQAVSLVLATHWGFPAFILWQMPAAAQPRFDVALVARVAVGCAVFDVVFHWLHCAMHRHLPRVHVLHHCNVFPCTTAGSIMSQGDAALNTLPPLVVIALLLTDLVPGMKDPFALIVCLSIFVTNLDHDAWLTTPHSGHHLRADSDYSYFSYLHFWRTHTRRDAADQVRAMIFDVIQIDR